MRFSLIPVFALLALFVFAVATAQAAGYTDCAPVTVEKLPQTVEEFVTLRDTLATTPQGGATMMLLAMYIYGQDEKLGVECLTVAIDMDQLDASPTGYKGYAPRKAALQHLKSYIAGAKAYVIHSFFPGTTPENGYTVSPAPWKFVWQTNPYSGAAESGRTKLFLRSSGADSSRPMSVKVNDKGLWKATEWSSFTVGVRKPGKPDDTI